MASIDLVEVRSIALLNATHSYEVWETIHEYFQLQTKVRVHQLCTDLRSVQLDGKSMCKYLSQIKSIADELASVGILVKHEEYVDVILVNLPQEYALVIAVIEGNFKTPPVNEVEAQLLSFESLNNQFCQQSFPRVNYASHGGSGTRGGSSGSRGGYGASSVSHGSGSVLEHGGASDCSGRGRGGRFANFQRQICLKFGHTANVFHF